MGERHGNGTVSLWAAGLPLSLKARDGSGTLRALVAVADGQLQARYRQVAAAFDDRDPSRCEARLLPELSRGRGWRLDGGMPVALQRKVVASLVTLYRQKGTGPGLLNAVRLFLGEEARLDARWASRWRLGRSRLGGYSAHYTASGGETSVDLSGDPLWSCAPHATRVRAWVNDVELGPEEFLPLDRATVAMVTQGTRYVAAAGDTRVYLTFVYAPGRNALVVTRNGRRVDQPAVWREFSAGPYTGIDFVSPLADGDVIVVRHLESVTPLAAGDEVRLRSGDGPVTRLPGDTLAGTDAGIFLDMPRGLTAAEVEGLTQVTEMMRPATQPVFLRHHEDPRPRWRIGESMLGRSARMAR